MSPEEIRNVKDRMQRLSEILSDLQKQFDSIAKPFRTEYLTLLDRLRAAETAESEERKAVADAVLRNIVRSK